LAGSVLKGRFGLAGGGGSCDHHIPLAIQQQQRGVQNQR
jgi:hypothetical protein